MKWEEAIIQVLAEEERPMSSVEITKKIIDKGYRDTKRNDKPEQTVAGILSKNENGWFEYILEDGKCKGNYKLVETYESASHSYLASDKTVGLVASVDELATLATTGKSTVTKAGSHVSLRDLVLACIETIGRKCFDTQDIYAFAPIFKVCVPQYQNLESALKQQLDELVNEGRLEALRGDCYSMK